MRASIKYKLKENIKNINDINSLISKNQEWQSLYQDKTDTLILLHYSL